MSADKSRLGVQLLESEDGDTLIALTVTQPGKPTVNVVMEEEIVAQVVQCLNRARHDMRTRSQYRLRKQAHSADIFQ